MGAWNDLERRMLSGEPFTYSGIQAERRGREPDRVVDRTIQKLRRKGLIAFHRVGRECIWRATATYTPQTKESE